MRLLFGTGWAGHVSGIALVPLAVHNFRALYDCISRHALASGPYAALLQGPWPSAQRLMPCLGPDSSELQKSLVTGFTLLTELPAASALPLTNARFAIRVC